MLFNPVAGTLNVLGSGLWNADNAAMGSYVDVYDPDEGDVLRLSVEKSAGDAPSEGDVIEAVVSSREQSKTRSVGQDERRETIVVEKIQLRLRSYRLVARMVLQPIGADAPALSEAA